MAGAKTRYTPTKTLEERLAKYNRRINQLKTIQLKRQTELNLILNQPEAWIRSKNWGKNATQADKLAALEKRKEELSDKNTRLDILLMKAEGGKITQAMFDYGENNKNIFRKKGKNFIERFNLVKPDGTAYVVGDTYIPIDTDRFSLIENIEDILEERDLNEELGYKEEKSSMPTVEIKDPKNKFKTIKIDKEDYLSGTDFRDEQQVIDSLLLDKLRIQKENVESKIDLTKQLTIQDF